MIYQHERKSNGEKRASSILKQCERTIEKGTIGLPELVKWLHITFIFIMLAIIAFWIVELKQGEMPYLDLVTRDTVAIVSGTSMYTFFRWMTELGSRQFVLPFVIIMMGVLWILYRRIVPALLFGLGTLAAQMVNRLIKHLIARERPSISSLLNAEGFSFPSGHAVTAIVCYGLLAYFFGKRFPEKKKIIYVLFGILTVLIGMSRYFINVHYLTDVIAGFFLGYLCLIAIFYLDNLADKRKR